MKERIFPSESEKKFSGEDLEKVDRIFGTAAEKKGRYDEENEKDRKDLDAEEYLKKLVSNFPSHLKDRMVEDVGRWFGYHSEGKLSKDDVNLEARIQAKRMRESYVDGFGMLNKEYGKMVVMNEIDKVLEGEKSSDNFKRVARVSMDLNGLKAVNDLNGEDHEEGDDYIRLAVQSVTSGELVVWADSHGLKLLPIHDSGDEFSIIVTGEKNIDDNDLVELMDMIKENLYGKREAADLVDLADDSVLYNLYEAEMKSMNEPIEPKDPKLFKKLRAEIPEGFEFRAAISAGAINLYDALAMDKTKKNEIRDGDGYERMLEKMMGSLKSVSDKEMGEKKKREKESLAQSGDTKKKMLARIYNFREAGVLKMKQKREEAEKKLSAKEEKEQTARKMLNAGVSEKEVLKFLLE